MFQLYQKSNATGDTEVRKCQFTFGEYSAIARSHRRHQDQFNHSKILNFKPGRHRSETKQEIPEKQLDIIGSQPPTQVVPYFNKNSSPMRHEILASLRLQGRLSDACEANRSTLDAKQTNLPSVYSKGSIESRNLVIQDQFTSSQESARKEPEFMSARRKVKEAMASSYQRSFPKHFKSPVLRVDHSFDSGGQKNSPRQDEGYNFISMKKATNLFSQSKKSQEYVEPIAKMHPAAASNSRSRMEVNNMQPIKQPEDLTKLLYQLSKDNFDQFEETVMSSRPLKEVEKEIQSGKKDYYEVLKQFKQNVKDINLQSEGSGIVRSIQAKKQAQKKYLMAISNSLQTKKIVDSPEFETGRRAIESKMHDLVQIQPVKPVISQKASDNLIQVERGKDNQYIIDFLQKTIKQEVQALKQYQLPFIKISAGEYGDIVPVLSPSAKAKANTQEMTPVQKSSENMEPKKVYYRSECKPSIKYQKPALPKLVHKKVKVKENLLVPESNIKMMHQEDSNNYTISHPINVIIQLSNDLIKMASRLSQLGPHDNASSIVDLKLLKASGIIIPRQAVFGEYTKSRDFTCFVREKALKIQAEAIRSQLGAKSQQLGWVKFYVGTGNNFVLVKQILKKRHWMTVSEKCNFDECDLIWTSWWKQKYGQALTPISESDPEKYESRPKLYGRMEGNYHLSNKKSLFLNLKIYYELKGLDIFKMKVVPLTFHIKQGKHDLAFKEIQELQQKQEITWIVKPGENSNRGCGISLCKDSEEIFKFMESQGREQRTYIIQEYIRKPLLINKRKFDIRVFGLLSCYNGVFRGYFLEDGYLRTSCKEFSLSDINNRFIHLTNDAVQQKAEDYGKFENGNKLSFNEFQRYLDDNQGSQSGYTNVNFLRDILPQIRHLITESFRAVSVGKIDPHKRQSSFEIFGFDFMLDKDFTPFLIEANTNPCLETSCPLLARIISGLLESAFRIVVDPVLPPNDFNFKRGNEALGETKFKLVFDETEEGPELQKLFSSNMMTNEDIDNISIEDEEDEVVFGDEQVCS